MMPDIKRNEARLTTLQIWNFSGADCAGTQIFEADARSDPLIAQFINYTDFPAAEIDIWCGRPEYNWVH